VVFVVAFAVAVVALAVVVLALKALFTPGVLMLAAELNLVALAAPSLIWAKEWLVIVNERPAMKQTAMIFIIPVLIGLKM